VFYLTTNGEKLRPDHQQRVKAALAETLQAD
jgi:hypothetical protein